MKLFKISSLFAVVIVMSFSLTFSAFAQPSENVTIENREFLGSGVTTPRPMTPAEIEELENAPMAEPYNAAEGNQGISQR